MTAGGNILNCYRHYRGVKLNISDVVPKKAQKTDTMFQKDKFKLHFGHCFDLSEWLKTLKDLTSELANAL